MGFGSFFAGLAADAAKEYVNKRRLDGMLEDAGNLKNKVTDMFSENNDEYDYQDDDYSDYENDDTNEDFEDEEDYDSLDDLNRFWRTLDSYIGVQEYDLAEKILKDYIGDGDRDDFVFYVMAYIYDRKAIELNSYEDAQKAKSFITNAVNMCDGNADWRKSVYNLRKLIDDDLNLLRREKEETKQAQLSTPSTTTNSVSEEEAVYLEELKVCYEDGVITDKECRLLNRLRKSLGISEARAAELEAMCQPLSLIAEEQEYANEVKACLEDDGVITAKERRLLDRLAKSLGISADRADEIECLIAR